jgi:LCP family protein required for cell wall assembly
MHRRPALVPSDAMSPASSRRSGRQHRARRTWPQRLVLTTNVVAIFATLAVAGGLTYLNHELSQVQRIDFGRDVLETDVAAGEPQNYLIVGNDSDDGLDPNDPVSKGRGTVGGVRSDSIMILRIDPKETKARILSFPRDLYVEIAGTGSRSRINSAFQHGQDTLPLTIQQNFGIEINHYIEVNFHGFKELVGAIGGVPVYFPERVRDRDGEGNGSGLKIPEPGCYKLDSGTALAFTRSRHYQVFRDGRWVADPESDLGRIKRQQFFIEQAMKRAVDKGARNPGTLASLISVGTKNVTLSSTLSNSDLIKLGKRFKDFDPGSLEKLSLPVDDMTIGGADVLQLRVAEAEPTLNLFRGVEPGTVTPAGVRVKVLNGSGTKGLAKDVTGRLASLGFATGEPSDAEETTGTVVQFAPGRTKQAQLVGRHLVSPVTFKETTGLDVDVAVIAGSSFEGVTAEPKSPTEVVEPKGSTPSTTTTAPGTPPPTAPGATVPLPPELDFVPDEPPEGMDCAG